MQHLTLKEAAAQAGIAPNTLRTYMTKGKIRPIPGTEMRGKPPLFDPADIPSIRGLWESYQGKRAAKREAILSSGERACTRCLVPKSLDEYDPHPAGIAGKHSQCRECKRESARLFAQTHREKRIAYKREYRQREREKVKAYKREYQRRITEEKGPVYIRWRRYMNRYQKWYLKLTRAIEDGKTSPICRVSGFSVVITPDRKLRAARLDKPLYSGETALVHYYWGATIGKWLVYPPPIQSAVTERITSLCLRREKGRKRDDDL